jgi:pyruvate dehydrogenase (quinone)/pyruvate oxidase
MIYLGNPEYGVDLKAIDFVKVAEGCGAAGVRIENPKHCKSQLKEALALDGPVVIECVTDPYEPPMPPKVTRAQTKHLAEAMARGERDRGRVALTMGRHAMDEALFPASSYGAGGRLKEIIAGKKEDVE